MPSLRFATTVAACALIAGCSRSDLAGMTATMPDGSAATAAMTSTCGDGRAMTVRFYDVGQALAVLVELPDGRHVLVDAGDEPRRPGCGEVCAAANRHLLDSLRRGLARGTHRSALDHPSPLGSHGGRAVGARCRLTSARTSTTGATPARQRCVARGARPKSAASPCTSSRRDGQRCRFASRGDVRLTAVVPPAWPASCAHDANECSVGLRIDDCSSSVLLLGDAEHEEEATARPGRTGDLARGRRTTGATRRCRLRSSHARSRRMRSSPRARPGRD